MTSIPLLVALTITYLLWLGVQAILKVLNGPPGISILAKLDTEIDMFTPYTEGMLQVRILQI